MKLYELIYTNTVITCFLSYMGFMAGEGEERAMKVKKENTRDVEEGRGIKEGVNMIRFEHTFMWKCHNDTLALYC